LNRYFPKHYRESAEGKALYQFVQDLNQCLDTEAEILDAPCGSQVNRSRYGTSAARGSPEGLGQGV